jgi:hypothetical protein
MTARPACPLDSMEPHPVEPSRLPSAASVTRALYWTVGLAAYGAVMAVAVVVGTLCAVVLRVLG